MRVDVKFWDDLVGKISETNGISTLSFFEIVGHWWTSRRMTSKKLDAADLDGIWWRVNNSNAIHLTYPSSKALLSFSGDQPYLSSQHHGFSNQRKRVKILTSAVKFLTWQPSVFCPSLPENGLQYHFVDEWQVIREEIMKGESLASTNGEVTQVHNILNVMLAR